MKALSGRSKKCEVCPNRFVPTRTFQTWCSPDCAVQIAKAARAKDRKREVAAKREKLKTRQEWLKEVQTVFNRYIRERDHNQPCISCGRFMNCGDLLTGSRWDSGHYRSVGSCPALRFNALNCHRQCVNCNRDKSGNAVEYRIGLIKRIGINLVEWLEQEHQPNKYTIDELKEMKKRYSKMARDLKKQREST